MSRQDLMLDPIYSSRSTQAKEAIASWVDYNLFGVRGE